MADPDAYLPNGLAFARRRDFGDYLAAAFAERSASAEGGSTLEHVCDRAIAAAALDDAIETVTASGRVLTSDLLIVATGNPAPRLPAFFDRSLLDHPGVVADPLQQDGARRIDPAARVLVVGTGLTALDMLSTLVRSGHRGAIVAMSRRGLRPRGHAPMVLGAGEAGAAAAERPLDRITGPVPAYWAEAAGRAPTALDMLRRMRRRAAMLQAQGSTWHAAIDELRDSLWQTWPLWERAEKQRFLRVLRPWYDVHRFRAPPQNDALVRRAEAAGQVTFRAARVRAIEASAAGAGIIVRFAAEGTTDERREAFDAVINCTGLDAAAGVAANPFLAALVAQGWLRVDDTGLGFAVDARCRAIDAAGMAQERLRVIGPPTAGAFADPLGVVFIAAQIHRLVPDVLRALD